MTTLTRQLPKYTIQITIIGMAFVAFILVVMKWLPVGVDWHYGIPWQEQVGLDWKGSFLPASREFLQGKSPYNVGNFFNPPWTLFLFIPLSLIPVKISTSIMFVANWFAFTYTAYRLKMKMPWLLVFPFTIYVIINSYLGNIDGIVSLGLIMPPQIGLFFLLAKPQIGAPIALLWMVMAYQSGRMKEVIRIFAPVSIIILLSILIFYPWPFQSHIYLDSWANFSVFPRGIPLGLLLFVLSLKYKSVALAVASAPFLSPYVTIQSWAFVYLGILAVLPGFKQMLLVILSFRKSRNE